MVNKYLFPNVDKPALIWLLMWLMLVSTLATAQPTLVKDIVTSGTDLLTGANSFRPSSLVHMNGVIYYSAFHPFNGRELWKSNTATGETVLLRDISPGAVGSEPADLAVINNTLYFTANDGKSGRELWKSDGTSVGTVRVKDIVVGTLGSSPSNLINVGGILYFSANDGVSGRELWKSDGTLVGTVRVKDILIGAGSATPFSFINLNGTLYFIANDGVSGAELWKSNGTSAGTIRVKDINPGSGDALNEGNITTMNGMLYFFAYGGETTTGLWKSNGTAAGTVLIANVYPYGVEHLTSVNGTLYFAAEGELWKSNGTTNGTVLVKDIQPEIQLGTDRVLYDSSPSNLLGINGILYFSAFSYEHGGTELWRSDGTFEGTVLVKDLLPEEYFVDNPANGYASYFMPESSYPSELTNVNGILYCLSGSGFWKSDGTESGTLLVKKLYGGGEVINVNGTLFLAAIDEGGSTELWKSNGSTAGTSIVRGAPGNPAGANPQHAVNMGGTLYFATGNPSRGYELWKSNGTNAGTTLVKKVGTELRGLTNAGGKLYFLGNDGSNGLELWKSNGTLEGTVMVKDIYPGSSSSNVSGLTMLNGVVYFAADDGTNGREFWRSDGTASGTFMVKDILPGGEWYYKYHHPDSEVIFRHLSSNPDWIIVMNGFLYFHVISGSNDDGELWKSDGTAAGTVLVADINPEHISPNEADQEYLTNLTGLNGMLYFTGDDGSGSRLWKSDGTEAGTVKLTDVYTRKLHKFGNTLYFFDSSGGLWRSNGTGAGTMLIKSIAGSTYEQFLTAVGNVIYFTTEHPTYGREIWRSDGTDIGTYLLKNITPGTAGSEIASFAGLGSDLYFSVAPQGGAPTLWKSNGTSAGTFKMSSMQAYNLIAMNGVLYFSGNDGLSGFELWKYNPATCITSSTATALQGSTVCLGTNATVTIKAAQAGVRYGLYYNGAPFSTQKVGNGTDLSFTIPAASLFAGSYTFSVKAEGCQETTLSATATITVTSPLAAPLSNSVTINNGQKATLTASGAPAGASYRWYAAALGGTPLATTATYTTPLLSSTTTYYVAVYQLPCGDSPRRAVTVTVNGSTIGKSFRVNAGGSAFTTVDARSFSADVYFTGGVVTTPTNLAIAGTADDFLYQTGRHGSSFSYNFATGSGAYDVVLHFAETYYGNTAPGGIGSRKFNVDIEGVRRLTDYDVFAKAGGALRAKQETFRVTVSDGTLNVAFLKGAADNPAVKAIEVLPAGSALAINAGGGVFRTADKNFSQDSYYADGTPATAVTGDVLNTTDDVLYQTGRSGAGFSYGLPSGNGIFNVTLHFAETYYGNRVTGGVGSRKFNVYLEGVKRLTDYDIFAKAGGAMRAVKETMQVTVSDGVLNLYFANGSAGNAYISAIEAVPVTLAAREAIDEETVNEEWQVQLYPNPVQDKLLVELPFAVSVVKGTTITDAAGVLISTNAHKVCQHDKLEIQARELKRGLYYFRVDTDRGYRVIKFIKQ